MEKLVDKICQPDIEAFKAKVIACLQEKDNVIQALQLEDRSRNTKLVELREKLEKEIILFRHESTQKDRLIADLELRVWENNLTKVKIERNISILITMVREERARVRFLSQDKAEEDQEIADIRSGLEAKIIAVDGDCVTTADTKVADDNNDDALTEEIELNESIETEKLLEENEDKKYKDRGGTNLDTFENHGDKEVANILEADGEMTHTADTLLNMIDNLLGK